MASMLKVFGGLLVAAAVLIDLQWLFPDVRQSRNIIHHIVFPPQGDLPDIRDNVPTASQFKLMRDLYLEFVRCGGSNDSDHKTDAYSWYESSLDQIGYEKTENAIWEMGSANNGLTIRWAQLCHTLGVCQPGLPSFVYRPKQQVDARNSVLAAREPQEVLKALAYACGQGARERAHLPVL